MFFARLPLWCVFLHLSGFILLGYLIPGLHFQLTKVCFLLHLHVSMWVLNLKKISPASFSSSFLVAMVIAHSTAICFMTARNHLHKVRSFLTPPFKINFYCRYSDEVWLTFTYFTFITRPRVFLSLSNIHTHKFIQKAYTHHQITHLQHTEYKIETLCTAVVAWQYTELCSRNKHKHHRIYVEKYLL